MAQREVALQVAGHTTSKYHSKVLLFEPEPGVEALNSLRFLPILLRLEWGRSAAVGLGRKGQAVFTTNYVRQGSNREDSCSTAWHA